MLDLSINQDQHYLFMLADIIFSLLCLTLFWAPEIVADAVWLQISLLSISVLILVALWIYDQKYSRKQNLRKQLRFHRARGGLVDLKWHIVLRTLFWLGFLNLILAVALATWASLTQSTFTFFALFQAAGLAFFAFTVCRQPSIKRGLLVAFAQPSSLIVTLYGIASFVGTYLLILPFAVKGDRVISFLDSYFMSASALTVTGLATINVANDLSMFGQFVLLGLIQIGGLSAVFLLVGYLWFRDRQSSLLSKQVAQVCFDLPTIARPGDFLKFVLVFTLVVELIGAIYLFFTLPGDMPRRWFHALFHSISAFCNAGLGTFAPNLDVPDLWMFKWGIALLIVIGGLGYPVAYELLHSFRAKRWRLQFHSRATLVMTAILLSAGAVLMLLIERTHLNSSASFLQDLAEAIFYSVSSRTAGFNITPMSSLTEGSQAVVMVLMAIGAGSVSTAGGIKVTTLLVLFATAVCFVRGRSHTHIFKGEISSGLIQKAITIFMLYVSIATFAVIVLLITESITPWQIIFEVLSALSNVGLSLGVTESLSPFGKIIVILLMIVGRVGILTFILAALGRIRTQRIRYAEENLLVG